MLDTCSLHLTMTSNGRQSETSPLLGSEEHEDSLSTPKSNPKVRAIVWGSLTVLFVATVILLVGFEDYFGDAFAPWLGKLPKDPHLAALAILDRAPVIVSFGTGLLYRAIWFLLYTSGRSYWFVLLFFTKCLLPSVSTDLPILVRSSYSNNVSAVDLESEMPGHVDIPRLRKGKVGGFFW